MNNNNISKNYRRYLSEAPDRKMSVFFQRLLFALQALRLLYLHDAKIINVTSVGHGENKNAGGRRGGTWFRGKRAPNHH